MAPNTDLRILFLFLCEASQRPANGFISRGELTLLKSFDVRTLTGNPARTRKILTEQYGSLEEAFQQMHTSWFRRALAKGLAQTALAGLLNVIRDPDQESTTAVATVNELRAESVVSRRPGSVVTVRLIPIRRFAQDHYDHTRKGCSVQQI